MEKKRKKKIIVFVLAMICIFYLLKTGFGRYSFNNVWNYYLESQKFFFTSDNLSNDQMNVDTFWNGGSVQFNLKNFSNSDLISDKDIAYQVTCEVLDEGEEECSLNGTGNSTITGVLSKIAVCVNKDAGEDDEDEDDASSLSKTECEEEGYSWEKSLVTNNLYFDIESEEEIENVRVRITASSTSPFRKSISGIFSLMKNGFLGAVDNIVNHYDAYDELIITNSYEIDKCVSVSFDTTKRIVEIANDMTILSSDEDGYVETFGLEIGSLSNKKIIFYSKDYLTNFSDIIVNEEEC